MWIILGLIFSVVFFQSNLQCVYIGFSQNCILCLRNGGIVTIDIMPMIVFIIVGSMSTIFNVRVIVYRSKLSFIYLRFIGHWVVPFSMLLCLDWDSLRTCLAGLRRSL